MGSIAKINGDTWHMGSDIPYHHRPGFELCQSESHGRATHLKDTFKK
jgi:hypothetical protein